MEKRHEGKAYYGNDRRRSPTSFVTVEIARADSGQAKGIDNDGVADDCRPESTFITLNGKNDPSDTGQKY
ncbi:hypothetical protein [Mesorhizobium sp.]|uniref:hypothetical protein n=1 Tax=Mesorhizobium sp. TaxID=1871066 RepID=UPI0025B90100|nr:hypothetical protein [Mesorhizobium sp.]